MITRRPDSYSGYFSLIEELTLYTIFRLAERSLFAQGDVKMISFFTVRDIPLCFISFNRIFSEPVGGIYPIFV